MACNYCILTQDTEFPYVGGSLVYNCTVSGNGVHLNSYVHFVNSTYPRGKEKYVSLKIYKYMF